MTAQQPFDIPSWSKAFIEGKLSAPEIDQLRLACNPDQWYAIVRRKAVKDIIAKDVNTTKDICRLLAMLIEQLQP